MTERFKQWSIGKTLCVVFILAGLTIKPEFDEKSFFLQYSYLNIIVTLFVLIYVAYAYDRIKAFLLSKKNMVVCVLLGIIAAFFIVVGYSFETVQSIDVVKGAAIRNAVKFLTLSYTFTTVFALAFAKINDYVESASFLRDDRKSVKGLFEVYLNVLHSNPFWTAVITVFILLIPFLVASYPAIFMGDTHGQLAQAFNSSSFSRYQVDYGSTSLDNHHPLAHTMLMYVCVKAGVSIFGSWNLGIFIYTLVQYFFMLFCVGFVVKAFVEEKMADIWPLLYMLYVVFAGGHVGRYYFLATKDIIYTGFMMLFIVGIYKALNENRIGKAAYIGGFGMLAFRKEAFYILLLTVMCCFILKLFKRRKLCMVFAGIIIIHVMWNNVLVPAMGIHAGSTREVLSLPLQMTGRYVVNFSDEVTDEERQAIDAIVKYDKIADNYDPKHSSPIKNTFREDSTRADLINYFNVFIKMFFKHPQIYFYALLEFKDELFYPDTFDRAIYHYPYSADRMGRANEWLKELGANFHYPDNSALSDFREWLDDTLSIWNGYPIINLFNSAATFVWWTIIVFAYSIIRKNKYIFILTMPLLATILFCILGPQSGGHVRYMYPLQMALPCISAFGLKFSNENVALIRNNH